MSLVEVTAEKTNDSVLLGYKLSTESRLKTGSDTIEEMRAILRVVIGQQAQNVSAVSQPRSLLYTTATLNVRFNRDSLITLYPLKDISNNTYNFRLVDQDYTPYAVKGSTFFDGVLEYVSVTPWEELTWI